MACWKVDLSFSHLTRYSICSEYCECVHTGPGTSHLEAATVSYDTSSTPQEKGFILQLWAFIVGAINRCRLAGSVDDK